METSERESKKCWHRKSREMKTENPNLRQIFHKPFDNI